MPKPLPPAFFNRPTLMVAEELIGKFLVRKLPRTSASSRRTSAGHEVAMMITETEAYDGFEDRASHASRGQTPRNTPMFGKAGVAYVYFTYGMHWMFNIVCGPQKYPAAVLIRGVEGISGPARLTKALQIDRTLNGKPLGKASGLWVEDRGVVIPPRQIQRTPRVGVDYAGKWAKKPWRFVLKAALKPAVRKKARPAQK